MHFRNAKYWKTNRKVNLIGGCGDISNIYNVNSYPTHIIIDKNSIVSYSTIGFRPITLQEIESTIEELIK